MDDVIPSALDLARHLEGELGPTVLVGGAPRDLLLGRSCRDVDLAVSAPLQALVEARPGTRLVGRPPRQSALLPWRGRRFEIVSLQGLSLEEELARRDLTVNALALTTGGRFVDVCGGGQDLALGRLRFNGSARERLSEDPLRALRIFRFAATLPAFSVDRASFEAASAVDLASTAPDRLGGELLRAASGDLPLFLEHLGRSGLLERAYPVLSPLAGDIGEKTIRRLKRLGPLSSDVAFRLAALLLDIPRDRALAEALVSWRWPREIAATVRRLLADGAPRPGEPLFAGRHLRWRPRERQGLFLLARAGLDGDAEGRRWFEERKRALAAELSDGGKRLFDGLDVMAVLALPPGRAVGQVLDDLDDARAGGAIATRAEALAWLEARKRRGDVP
ncbi:CCA tRNA nucleotidyltransferase [Aminithiophilus ramosus]|uniref:CCA tRNA nucleotidyltransferase n=2 Tax=Synergistales TaxID=649776 RepID=A0A9Q7APZ5_9BACT|nr:hypothetical protein [Aminithiophilus ramosus]QTX32747.1 CCA tRNA nucleotidyltransferase [Aminithiophilus ramosus]QVL36624.1 CCA tRNA nucleotidyltransferase [Synergistota bacterium]